MSFAIGQYFEREYPPEAAFWCNENEAYIEEVDAVKGNRQFVIRSMPTLTDEEVKAQGITRAKEERADAVGNITVEVDGMIFDGNEVSQQRIARCVMVLNDGESISWVLADNSVAPVTKEQLKKVLIRAVIKQSELWVGPYN